MRKSRMGIYIDGFNGGCLSSTQLFVKIMPNGLMLNPCLRKGKATDT